MVHSEYSMEIYKSVKISIGTVMKKSRNVKVYFLVILKLKKNV